MRARRNLVASVAAALILFASACGAPKQDQARPEPPKPTAQPAQSAQPQQAQKPVAPKEKRKVRMGEISSASDSGIYVALQKGYFAQQGIEIEFVPFDSAAKMVPALATGQLDIGSGAPGAGFFNSIARGIEILIVADKGAVTPKQSYMAWVARKELVEKGALKQPKDLKGLKVGLPATGITPHVELGKLLESGGLTEKDVEIKLLPFNQVIAALQSGGVDVSALIEPFVTKAEELKVGARWKSSGDVYPNHQVAAIFYAPSFVQKHPDAAKDFMVAYLKGVRDYNDAFVKGDARKRAEVIEILAQSTPVKDKPLYDKMQMPYLNPNGYVNVQSIKADQDWFVKMGLVTKPIDVDKIIDHSFVQAAIKELGEYK